MGANDIARKQIKFGGFIQNANNWASGTAELVAAGNGMRLLEMGIKAGVEHLPDESGTGTSSQWQGATGAETHEGPVRCYGKYEDLEALIGAPFGTAADPIQSAGTAYYSDFTVNDIMANVYRTMVFWDGRTTAGSDKEIIEYSHVKGNELVVQGTMGKRLEYSFGNIARDMVHNSAAGINKSSTWAAITEPTVRYIYLFNDANYTTNFFLNLQDGADFDSDDVVYPNEFTFTVSPSLTGDVTSQNAPYVDQPDTADWLKIALELKFPKTANHTHWDRWKAGTAVKFKFVNEGPQIAATGVDYGVQIWSPGMMYMGVDDDALASGAGRASLTLNFEDYLCTAAPTGFPAGIVRSMMRLYNTKQAAAF